MGLCSILHLGLPSSFTHHAFPFPVVFSLGMLPNESLSQKFLSQNQIILWELVKISYKVILTQGPQSKFSHPKRMSFSSLVLLSLHNNYPHSLPSPPRIL